MTPSARAELVDTLKALLDRIEDGDDIETIALVVVSQSDGLTPLLIGADQEAPIVHAIGLAAMSMCCELVDEANESDSDLSFDGPGDDRGRGAN
jgi:hypothetical protein